LNLRSGEKLSARQLILATPWQVTSRLLSVSEIDELKAIAQRSASLVSSPITGIHLVFDRKVVPYTELALLDTTIQWVFDHTEADLSQNDSMVPDQGQSLHLVVSASHGLSALNREEILAIAMQELKSAFPVVCHAKLLSSWVVTNMPRHSVRNRVLIEFVPIRPQEFEASPLLVTGRIPAGHRLWKVRSFQEISQLEMSSDWTKRLNLLSE
jgi:predicted NAD/FAD-dependent oxidoreductase